MPKPLQFGDPGELGPFRLESRLHESAAGIVYLGVDPQGRPVEVALLLAPGEVGTVHVTRTPGSVVATAPVGEIAVAVAFITPPQSAPFHALAVTDSAVHTTELPLGSEYLYPAIDAFLDMVATGSPAVPYEELLRPVRFLAAVADQLR